jgi:hypothetical protein
MEMCGVGRAGPVCALSEGLYGLPLALPSVVGPLYFASAAAGLLYMRFRIAS